jgi:hypothetical protein
MISRVLFFKLSDNAQADSSLHCEENSWIFRNAADQTLPVTEYSEIDNGIKIFSYIFRKIQLQVTFGLLHLGKSGSFRHSVSWQCYAIR